MSDLLAQNYELAYHITTNLEEADVQKTRSEIENVLTSNQARISYAKDPEKIRLSYPIKHQQHAYFGYIHFSLEDGQALDHVNEGLKTNGNILRYLLMKLDDTAGKDADSIKRLSPNDRKRVGRKAPAKASEAAPVQEAELEKKIEDILEKI